MGVQIGYSCLAPVRVDFAPPAGISGSDNSWNKTGDLWIPWGDSGIQKKWGTAGSGLTCYSAGAAPDSGPFETIEQTGALSGVNKKWDKSTMFTDNRCMANCNYMSCHLGFVAYSANSTRKTFVSRTGAYYTQRVCPATRPVLISDSCYSEICYASDDRRCCATPQKCSEGFTAHGVPQHQKIECPTAEKSYVPQCPTHLQTMTPHECPSSTTCAGERCQTNDTARCCLEPPPTKVPTKAPTKAATGLPTPPPTTNPTPTNPTAESKVTYSATVSLTSDHR